MNTSEVYVFQSCLFFLFLYCFFLMVGIKGLASISLGLMFLLLFSIIVSNYWDIFLAVSLMYSYLYSMQRMKGDIVYTKLIITAVTPHLIGLLFRYGILSDESFVFCFHLFCLFSYDLGRVPTVATRGC